MIVRGFGFAARRFDKRVAHFQKDVVWGLLGLRFDSESSGDDVAVDRRPRQLTTRLTKPCCRGNRVDVFGAGLWSDSSRHVCSK